MVDLSGLRYIGAPTMHVLVDAQEALMGQGPSLALACPQPQVKEALELWGVNQRIPVYGTVREATAGHVRSFWPQVGTYA